MDMEIIRVHWRVFVVERIRNHSLSDEILTESVFRPRTDADGHEYELFFQTNQNGYGNDSCSFASVRG